MKILRYPLVNGVFVSLFSCLYAVILIITSNHIEFQRTLYYTKAKAANSHSLGNNSLSKWGEFLYNGHQKYIGFAIIALTVFIIVLLILRKNVYDEYHVEILSKCFLTAGLITIVSAAIFFFLVLSEPTAIVEKIILFVILHWTSMLAADLIFILACRAK
jgi:large-conductance mechanosensitive channel